MTQTPEKQPNTLADARTQEERIKILLDILTRDKPQKERAKKRLIRKWKKAGYLLDKPGPLTWIDSRIDSLSGFGLPAEMDLLIALLDEDEDS